MKYWTICYPDEDGKDVIKTLSEEEIIAQYYPYWSSRMIEKFGKVEFDKTWSTKECIEDWVTTHWAWAA